jgi:hypothetical protein
MSDRTAKMTTVPVTANVSTQTIEGDLNVTGDYYQNGEPLGGGGGGNVVGPDSSVSADFAQFSGTTGELLADNGLSLTTDGTLASDSDVLLPSEKAVKTYADTKAPLASPALTGTPTAPTATALTDNTQVATTAYADSAVTAAARFSNQETVSFSGSSATLGHTPNGKFFMLCQNGLILAPAGADYTLSGAGLTLVNAPEAGDTFFAWYTY